MLRGGETNSQGRLWSCFLSRPLPQCATTTFPHQFFKAPGLVDPYKYKSTASCALTPTSILRRTPFCSLCRMYPGISVVLSNLFSLAGEYRGTKFWTSYVKPATVFQHLFSLLPTAGFLQFPRLSGAVLSKESCSVGHSAKQGLFWEATRTAQLTFYKAGFRTWQDPPPPRKELHQP